MVLVVCTLIVVSGFLLYKSGCFFVLAWNDLLSGVITGRVLVLGILLIVALIICLSLMIRLRRYR